MKMVWEGVFELKLIKWLELIVYKNLKHLNSIIIRERSIRVY